MGAGLEDLFGHEHPGEPDLEAGELRRALIVAAHPDDPDFGAAGTAALLAQAGWHVRYLVITDGSKGTDDPAMDAAHLVETRVREQNEAARILGVADVRFLGYTDGELQYTRDLLAGVTREIREYQPFAVYTHDPEPVIIQNAFVNHSDHRTTGLTTVDAVYPTARDRLNFPEHIEAGLPTHKVREMYLWGVNEPNFSVDITDVLETKIEALLAHRSQFPDPRFADQMRAFWREEDGRSREQFRRVVMFR
ncbi:MAG: PIG-L deacetylase family protein [Dehalococcoidia bacterium]